MQGPFWRSYSTVLSPKSRRSVEAGSLIRVFSVAHSQAVGTLSGTVRFEKHNCIDIDGEIPIKIISALQDIVGLVGNHVSL